MKKIISFILLLSMLVGMLCIFSVMTSAASVSGSTYSSNPTIAGRIDKALATYKPGSSFFTKNGKACSCHASSNINCVNSPSACNCIRKVTIDGKTVDLLAVQCFGFARYWQQSLFGAFENNTSKFQKLSGVSGSLNATNAKSWFTSNKDVLHPGTHIRCYNNGHSIIVLDVDYDKGTVTYIHSNWVNQSTNNGTWCKVMPITTQTFSQFASTFKTLNYAYVYKNYHTEYPDKVTTPIASDFNATIKDGIYSLKNVCGGKMLTVSGKSVVNGTPLVVSESNESVQQQFYFNHVGNGKYRIYPVCSEKNNSGYIYCIDTNIEAGNSGKLEIGDFFDTWKQESKWDYCQLFYIVPIANGKYVIELATMPQAVLGVKNVEAAETDGGAITLQNYTSAETQQWYFYDENGNEPVDPSIDGSLSHVINYDASGGRNAPASQRKLINVAVTLSSTIPEKEGYSFVGWRTSDGIRYQPGETYGANSNVTLYAVWKANEYNVKFDANGGTNVPAVQIKMHGVNLTLSTKIPTKSGYTFKGWDTSSNATTVVYNAGSTYSSNLNLTLYAVWNKDIVPDIGEDDEPREDYKPVVDKEPVIDETVNNESIKDETEKSINNDNDKATNKATNKVTNKVTEKITDNVIKNGDNEAYVDEYGCNSSIAALSSVLVVGVIGVAFACKKKED